MGTYIFSIKRSHWLKVSQTPAWKRVRGWVAAGMGCEWRKEQAGAMISKGNDPTPSLLFSQSASRSKPAAGERAGGRARQVRPRTRLAVAFPVHCPPAPTPPAGSPQERPRWGPGLAPPGQARVPRNFSHPGAPRRGRGAGSPESGV